MISDGVIRIEEMHFAGPVPDEGDNPTELEGTRLGRKLSLNCLFACRNNNNFDLCRPPGN